MDKFKKLEGKISERLEKSYNELKETYDPLEKIGILSVIEYTASLLKDVNEIMAEETDEKLPESYYEDDSIPDEEDTPKPQRKGGLL